MLCDDIDLSTQKNIIYMIRNELSPVGKCYIGQTINTFNKRYFKGVAYSSTNRYLKKAIKKYGERAFSIHILEVNIDPTKLNEREAYFIKKFDSANRERGYNLTLGGGNFGSPSDETRKLQSLVKTKPFEQVVEDFKKVHGDKFDYSSISKENYKNGSRTKIPIICKSCGRRWISSINNHIARAGCVICIQRDIAKAKMEKFFADFI